MASSIQEKDREIERLNVEMRKLSLKLDDARRENEDLRRENKELKLRPAQRAYVDADDERESNAWREKANNLLTLLDNLQHDMQNDLRDLEAETMSPGSTRLSKSVAAESAAAASPTKTVDEESSKKRRRKEEAAPAAAAAPAPVAAAAAPADESSSKRSRRRRDAEPMTEEQAQALDAGYKALGGAAKHMHALYKNIKEAVATEPAKQKQWADLNEPVKKAAKAAKAAAGKSTEPVSITSAEFSANATELTHENSEWVAAAIAFAASQKASKLVASADALKSASVEFETTFKAASAANGASVKAHADAASDLANAMRRVISEQAAFFGAATE